MISTMAIVGGVMGGMCACVIFYLVYRHEKFINQNARDYNEDPHL